MTLLDRGRKALLAATWTPRAGNPAEVAELRRLIGIVLVDSPAEEQREALTVAYADPDAALECFRLLAASMQQRP
ncbi:MAG: hypothetical protein ACYC9Z_10100 [Casimicrobiaceae bacterium]